MSFSEELLKHAIDLLWPHDSVKQLGDVQLRRAVSLLYYALFHQICASGAKLVAPNVPIETNHRIHRWFEHAEMKKVCGRFSHDSLDKPLRDLDGEGASPDRKKVVPSFIKLQEARHRSDCDLGYVLSFEEAGQFFTLAARAMASWDRIQGSAEANIFILSLLMWKNWDKERQS